MTRKDFEELERIRKLLQEASMALFNMRSRPTVGHDWAVVKVENLLDDAIETLGARPEMLP